MDSEDADLKLAIELSLKECQQNNDRSGAGKSVPKSAHEWQDLAFFTDMDLSLKINNSNDYVGKSENSLNLPIDRKQSVEESSGKGTIAKPPQHHSEANQSKEVIRTVENTVSHSNLCRGCKKPAVESVFFGSRIVKTFTGDIYHAQCFTCGGCSRPINGHYTIHNSSSTPYHKECFNCAGCNQLIEGNFTDHGEPPLPYHPDCGKELFGPRCCLCTHVLGGQFYRHPFFENEQYCLSHETRTACFACGRREPLPESRQEGFADLLDGRSLCAQCSGTIIIDSSEAVALYQSIVHFMGAELGLNIPAEMNAVPILVVDVHSLNENMNRQGGSLGYHDPTNVSNNTIRPVSMEGPVVPAGSTVRGLTLSTCAEVRHFPSGSMAFNQISHALRTGQAPTALFATKEVRDVTAVLVLYGLPRDLTASILAHEAMHVWLKLNRGFPFRMPPKLEEGLCQVIAYLYLESLVETELTGMLPTFDDPVIRQNAERAQEKEQSLRKYFRKQIRDDPSIVYGEGFRECHRVVQVLGLEVVLEYIQQHQQLPPM